MKTIFLISAIWCSSLMAQQEYRIGWTKAQFDSAFKGYLYLDPVRDTALYGGMPGDTFRVTVTNYKIGGVKGLWLNVDFIKGALTKTEWDVNIRDDKSLQKLVRYLDRKYGKRKRTYHNVDDEIAWVNKKFDEVYILKKSELAAAEGEMLTLHARRY